MKLSSGFTLVEILIACAVLGLVVFAILTMSTNNAHQIYSLETEKYRVSTDNTIEQCIRALGYTGMVSFLGNGTGSISFGPNGNNCLTGTTATGISFSQSYNNTPMTPVTIENSFIVQTGSIQNALKISLTTSSEKNSRTREFWVYQ